MKSFFQLRYPQIYILFRCDNVFNGFIVVLFRGGEMAQTIQIKLEAREIRGSYVVTLGQEAKRESFPPGFSVHKRVVRIQSGFLRRISGGKIMILSFGNSFKLDLHSIEEIRFCRAGKQVWNNLDFV
jgi:hypothetical protein